MVAASAEVLKAIDSPRTRIERIRLLRWVNVYEVNRLSRGELFRKPRVEAKRYRSSALHRPFSQPVAVHGHSHCRHHAPCRERSPRPQPGPSSRGNLSPKKCVRGLLWVIRVVSAIAISGVPPTADIWTNARF